MKKSVYLLGLFSVLLFSCQREIDPGIIATPGSGGSGGSGGGSSAAASFQPLTTGTWWKFKDSASGGITTMTVTPVNKTFNNIAYKAVKAEGGVTQTDTVYMAAPRPNYYYFSKDNVPSGGSFELVFNYLNDTASVGYSWNYTAGQGTGFSALSKATIKEKNITVTNASKTYTNVTRTRVEMTYDMGFGLTIDAGYYDFFSAKGVGLIRIRANVGAFGFTTETCSDLIDYQIR